MKLDGQLEKAQLENLSGNPASSPVGRVYIDVTTPSAAVPKVYNGTAWVPFLTGQSSSLVSNNSGKAITVNWANGLYQQVVLTDHATISFSNPQAGQVHMLMVTQRATDVASTAPYMFQFNLSDQDTRRKRYLPLGVLQSSESQVFAWFYAASIKAAYATIPVVWADPASLPATLMTGIDAHPTLNIIAGGRTSSPYIATQQYVDGGFKFFWGAKDVSTPTAAAAQGVSVAYHPEGHTLFLASGTSPYIQGYLVDTYGVSNLTVYANPGTLPAGAGKCVAVHPSGSHVVIGHTTTPFISCYPITSGGYGTKLTDPVSLPVAQVNAVAWSPTGDYLAVASQTTPYLEIYPFDPYTGFGAKLGQPGTLPAGGPPAALGKGLAWHPAGTYVAMAMSASPYATIYPFTRSTGVYGTPTTPSGAGAPAAAASCIQFSPCGNYIAIGNTANLFMYDVSAGGFSSIALAYDGSGPAVQVNDLVFHKSGEHIFLALNVSPYIKAYPVPRKTKNYVQLSY